MAYRIQLPGKDAQATLRDIVGDQSDKAIGALDDENFGVDQKVHELRKRCKKIRGVLRLYRKSLGDDYTIANQWFRDTAKLVDTERDAAAMIGTYDKLCDHFDNEIHRRSFAFIRARLTRYHKSAVHQNAAAVEQLLGSARSRLVEGCRHAEHWTVNEEAFDAIRGGLKKVYKRGRKALKNAQQNPSPERYHDWRKRVKHHRYHMRLLRSLWPAMMNRRRQELHDLSNLLGEAHDLFVLSEYLRNDISADNSEAVEAFVGLADQRRRTLERAAELLGENIYAEKPKHLVRRLKVYWRTWEEHAT